MLILEKCSNDLYCKLQKSGEAFVTVKKLKKVSKGPVELCCSLMPKGSVMSAARTFLPVKWFCASITASVKASACTHL